MQVKKFQLKPIARQSIKVPCSCQVIAAKNEYGKICLWAICDSDGLEMPLDVVIAQDDTDLPPGEWIYIDSMYHTSKMSHVFVEDKNEGPTICGTNRLSGYNGN